MWDNENKQKVYMKLQYATNINLTDTISNCDAVQLILDPSVFLKTRLL